MNIEVESLDKITPRCNRDHIVLMLDVSLEKRQAEHLFYQLWDDWGDKIFQEWIEAQGYTFIKHTTENKLYIDLMYTIL